jgi:maleylpyruvate isomerase
MAKQPQGLVPYLETNAGEIITQSGAIIHYLESFEKKLSLTPNNRIQATKMRAIVDLIACDIHPICNLRILKYLTDTLGVDEQAKLTWYRHWITLGFQALEQLLENEQFCVGNIVTQADVYLVPQVYNALRFEVNMRAFTKIMHIYNFQNKNSAFLQAAPEQQLDAN